MRRILAALFAVAVLTLSSPAQTNAPPMREVVQVYDAQTALAALLHFLGFSAQDVLLAGIVAHLAARGVRNTVLKNAGSDTSGLLARAVGYLAAKPLQAVQALPPATPPAATGKPQ